MVIDEQQTCIAAQKKQNITRKTRPHLPLPAMPSHGHLGSFDALAVSVCSAVPEYPPNFGEAGILVRGSLHGVGAIFSNGLEVFSAKK